MLAIGLLKEKYNKFLGFDEFSEIKKFVQISFT